MPDPAVDNCPLCKEIKKRRSQKLEGIKIKNLSSSFDPNRFGYKQQLDRSLSLWQLAAFGLNYMIPLSPAIFFGFVLSLSGGTVALPFIIAGIAIFFTAFSYATMVQHYPLAGSLYHYISLTWNRSIGFLAGWILLLDYLFITTVTSMSASLYITQLIHVPYTLILFVFIALTGFINFFGIQLVAWLGVLLLGLTELIVIISFIIWSRSIVHHAGNFFALFNWHAFHFTNFHALMSATSLAIASYLGFDAITTLAEEAKNPVKFIPRAIFICIFIGGFCMILTGYLAVLACPEWPQLIHNPTWQATALFYISRQTGGINFAIFYSCGFILSMAVFNAVATAATARLLFGMGRDNMLPKPIFARINSRWKTPHWNILFIMLLSFIVGRSTQVDQIADLVNYGALFGFACLNLSVISLYFKHRFKLLYQHPIKQFFCYLLFPAIGFFIVTIIFYNLDQQTLICGTAWLVIGIVYLLLIKPHASNEISPLA